MGVSRADPGCFGACEWRMSNLNQMMLNAQNAASNFEFDRLAAQQSIAYGSQNMLFGGRRTPAPSKHDKAKEYAADVRAKNPSMHVTRILNAATKNKPVVDADIISASTAQRTDEGISTAECH